jgi:hypothetical protein
LRQQFGISGAAIAFAGPALVQSRLGARGRELENGLGQLHYVCTDTNGRMRHFRRTTGTTTSQDWVLINTFGSNINSAPCMIEGQYTTKDELDVGNFELCVATNGRIEHWWRNNHSLGPWTRSAIFGNNVRRVVGLLEGSFGFNLELIAELLDGRYQHYWGNYTGWQAGPIIT